MLILTTTMLQLPYIITIKLVWAEVSQYQIANLGIVVFMDELMKP